MLSFANKIFKMSLDFDKLENLNARLGNLRLTQAEAKELSSEENFQINIALKKIQAQIEVMEKLFVSAQSRRIYKKVWMK